MGLKSNEGERNQQESEEKRRIQEKELGFVTLATTRNKLNPNELNKLLINKRTHKITIKKLMQRKSSPRELFQIMQFMEGVGLNKIENESKIGYGKKLEKALYELAEKNEGYSLGSSYIEKIAGHLKKINYHVNEYFLAVLIYATMSHEGVNKEYRKATKALMELGQNGRNLEERRKNKEVLRKAMLHTYWKRIPESQKKNSIFYYKLANERKKELNEMRDKGKRRINRK